MNSVLSEFTWSRLIGRHTICNLYSNVLEQPQN